MPKPLKFSRLAVVVTAAVSVFATGCLGGGPDQSGVFVSRDGGTSWQAAPDLTAKGAKKPKVFPPLEVTAVGVSPTDANTVVSGTDEELFLTTDGGKAWQRLTPKLPYGSKAISVQAVQFHPNQADTFYAGGVSAGYGKLIKSTDKGANLKDVFTVARPGQTITSIHLDPAGSDTLFVGDQLGSVYKSTDGAATWRRIFSVDSPISLMTASGDSLFVGTAGEGVFRSTDGGANFAPATGNLEGRGRTVWALAVGFGGLYAGTNEGLFLTRDFGATWQPVGNPLPPEGQRVQAIAVSGSAVYFATNAVVYRLTPNGDMFIPVQLQLAKNVFDLAATPVDATVLYAGAGRKNADFGDRFGAGVPQLLQAPRDRN